MENDDDKGEEKEEGEGAGGGEHLISMSVCCLP